MNGEATAALPEMESLNQKLGGFAGTIDKLPEGMPSSAMPLAFKLSSTWPMFASTIIRKSPYMPAPLFPANSSLGSHGVCGAG